MERSGHGILAPTGLCRLCGGRALERADPVLPLFRCRACGLIVNLRHRTPADEAAQYADGKVFDTPPAVARELWRWWTESQGAAPPRPGRVFDAGCGTGRFLQVAREHGWQVGGVELNAASARLACERLGDCIVAGPVDGCPGPAAPADAVTFWDVLDHLPDPLAALRQARGWLKPGGTVLVRVRNASVHMPLGRWYRRLQPILRRLGVAGNPGVVHGFGFTVSALTRSLEAAGFTRVRILPVRLTPGDRDRLLAGSPAAWLVPAVKHALGCLAQALFTAGGRRWYVAPSIMAVAVRPDP